jgi:MarR family transcriptional regulator, organic hydroperoxide resistance regulator
MSTKSPPHEALPTPDSKRRADAADPAFILEDSPFFLMNQATGAYALAMEQALKAVGADIPRWRVLMLAHERGPISVGEIAALGMLKLPTATKVVQRLSLEGLLSVTRSTADGRVTEVTCTPDGAEMVAKVRVVASARFHEAFDTFSAAELDLLNGMLRRILSALTR